MKKTFLMLAVGGLMLAAPSCKKGENDPGLSLASRKSRLAGDYNITGYESSQTNTNSSGTNVLSAILADKTITYENTYTPTSGSVTSSTWTSTLDSGEVSFTKDGTWSRVWNTTTVTVVTVGIQTTTTTDIVTETLTGSWNFLGKVDEFKNKERIVMNVLTMRSTDQQNDVVVTTGFPTTSNTGDKDEDTEGYSDGEWSMVYEIDQLKGKEVILVEVGGGSNSYKTTDYSTTPAVSTTWTNTDEFSSKITLTQK